jgi:hypothetical protein
MFKRIRWLSLGAAVGAASSLWARRKAKTLATRWTPSSVAGAAAGRVRAALADGREAMHQREAELRAGLAAPATDTPAVASAPLNGHRSH